MLVRIVMKTARQTLSSILDQSMTDGDFRAFVQNLHSACLTHALPASGKALEFHHLTGRLFRYFVSADPSGL
jgi:hypothetical protein